MKNAETIYFLDSYVIIGMAYGNENYAGFTKFPFFSIKWNLLEVYYCLLKKFGEKFDKFAPFALTIKDEHIFLAAQFKLKNNKREFSYIDVLGYTISQIEGYSFLTGDKQFEFLPDVEYIK